MCVRRIVYSLGKRYRLYDRSLPGRPDLVFPGRRKVIFVHGCFWHRHDGCRKAQVPKTRSDYWKAKFVRNVERDTANYEALSSAGWQILVVWECELSDKAALKDRIGKFLE